MMYQKTNTRNPFHNVLMWLIVPVLVCFSQQVKANNLQIGNVVVMGPNTNLHFVLVRFNISWKTPGGLPWVRQTGMLHGYLLNTV